jgi:hypothetical protein
MPDGIFIGLLVQLLKSDGSAIAGGRQSINDPVVVTFYLADNKASAAKLNQPFFEQPEVVCDEVKAAVDYFFDPGQGDSYLPCTRRTLSKFDYCVHGFRLMTREN